MQKFVANYPQEQRAEVARTVGAAILQDSFRHYVEAAWPVIERDKLITGNFLDCICDHLHAVAIGKIRRLIINVQPRIGKSTLANVLWPTWQWARDSGTSHWLFATATEELAIRDSVRRRNLIQSGWYQNFYGDSFQLTGDMNQKHHYVTNRGGSMYATFLGGAMGRGADFVVIDDPHKPGENMEIAVNYCRQSLFTRLNKPAEGRIVVIMQRLAVDDLSGVLLEGFDELPQQTDADTAPAPEAVPQPRPAPLRNVDGSIFNPYFPFGWPYR